MCQGPVFLDETLAYDKALVLKSAPVQIAKAHRGQWSFRKPGRAASKLSSPEELFAGLHFDREVIILCARKNPLRSAPGLKSRTVTNF